MLNLVAFPEELPTLLRDDLDSSIPLSWFSWKWFYIFFESTLPLSVAAPVVLKLFWTFLLIFAWVLETTKAVDAEVIGNLFRQRLVSTLA